MLYQAPELLRNPKAMPSTAVDVFAFGRLVYFVMSGSVPFDSTEQSKLLILKSAKRGSVPEMNWAIGFPLRSECKDLCHDCLRNDAYLRPTMTEVHKRLCIWPMSPASPADMRAAPIAVED